VIADHQQLLRIDQEKVVALESELEKQIIDRLPHLLQDVKIIAISDYGKGLLTVRILSELIQLGKKLGIPVISDPKGIDFTRYNGSTIIKPNQGEAYAAAGLGLDSSIEEVAHALFKKASSDFFLITRSEAGMSLFHKDGGRDDFPVTIRELKDVTGAGDTVLATLTMALAFDMSLEDGIRLSNIAAGLAIERLGCARIGLKDLIWRMLELNFVDKIFTGNEAHLIAQILVDHPYNLLYIKDNDSCSLSSLKYIHELSSSKELVAKPLLIVCVSSQLDPSLVHVLASIQSIALVLYDDSGMQKLFQQYPPLSTYSMESNLLAKTISLSLV